MKRSNHYLKHNVYAVSTAFNRINLQILSNRTGNNMENFLEAIYLGKKLMANLGVTREPNNIYTATGTVIISFILFICKSKRWTER